MLNSARESWEDNGALLSVALHEFGHAFGLDDNGTTKTIMNEYTYGYNSRYDTYRLNRTQNDDVNGVNKIY